jgi:tetratricopeptide (TPR) repeat protein
MLDWLRPLLMMFYAPVRGMSEVRDRAPLGSALLLAVLAQSARSFYGLWTDPSGQAARLESPLLVGAVLVQSLGMVLLVALILVPITIFIANLFEGRGGFLLAMQQEYAPLASTVFYAWAAASLVSLPLAVLAHASGLDAATLQSVDRLKQIQREMRPGDTQPPPGATSALLAASRYLLLTLLVSPLPLFGMWATIAVRAVFRLSWWRAISVTLVSGVVVFPATILLMWFAGWLFTSPFLILLLFFILRGYFGEVMRGQRARASFKQNLEAETLNPADASAHYNLGLIHQQRNESDAARQRFERAVEIDPEEVDAHYQLGRIARAQDDLPGAIKHFEQTVARDPAHAQHEIWREIGATYLAAGQFEDAREVLQRFLDHRESDPEGLYLMGCAHAGLGHQREAANSMQACIEAVKTAPAYKYRTDKRWLNEAQQFLRSQV